MIAECVQCGHGIPWDGLPPPGPEGRAWCGDACQDAWDALHPDEAAEWVPIERLTMEQRAELLALCGGGVSC